MEDKSELNVFRPTPLDLPAFLHFACTQLQAPFRLKTILRTQIEYTSKSKHSARSSHTRPSLIADDVSTVVSSASSHEPRDVTLVAVRDAQGHLVELIFTRCNQIPSLLLKIIGLCIPYHLNLSKISVRWGPTRGFGLKEIAKILPLSYLTDICLDNSPLPQHNFHILLEMSSPLRRLSLARCDIQDHDCALIASKLAYPFPASETLASLTLTSNFITDVGANAIGNTLRSNRTLVHLDLADNEISDTGAAYIFRMLMEFPLSEEETAMRNKRHLDYISLRNEVYDRCYKELMAEGDKKNLESRSKRRLMPRGKRSTLAWSGASAQPSLDAAALRAKRKTNQLVGPVMYDDPFSINNTFFRNGQMFSKGNMTISCLNLAYNHLNISTANWLYRVLVYQDIIRAGMGEQGDLRGLLRVVLDGNPMPSGCEELHAARVLLEQLYASKPPKCSSASPRPSCDKSREQDIMYHVSCLYSCLRTLKLMGYFPEV